MNGSKQKGKLVKYHFEEKESFLHLHAKKVLKEWIELYPERFNIMNNFLIRIEETFCENGKVIFKPDLCVYQGSDLTHIYEICHTSPLTGYKLHKMMSYFFFMEQNPTIFEVEADYIMRQIKCPENIKMTTFNMFDDGYKF